MGLQDHMESAKGQPGLLEATHRAEVLAHLIGRHYDASKLAHSPRRLIEAVLIRRFSTFNIQVLQSNRFPQVRKLRDLFFGRPKNLMVLVSGGRAEIVVVSYASTGMEG